VGSIRKHRVGIGLASIVVLYNIILNLG